MRQLQPVIWSKGTFLSPQHLQAQERFLEETLKFQLQSLSFCAWGFSELRIDAKTLGEGSLAIAKAVGVLPDGLPVDIPDSDPGPSSRTLEESFRDGRKTCVFYLAIPQHRPGGMNVALQRGGISARFISQLQMLRDENNGTNEKPVQLARKNLQLLAEGENQEGSILLPIAKIERTETGTYRLVSGYVPPMLNVKGSESLLGILRTLIELLVARSGQLAGARRQKNQSLAEFSASDIANFWLLYTINSHLPVLRHLFDSPIVHPELLFRQMLELGGALTTFSSTVEARDLARYSHEALGESFSALQQQLRELLETVIPSNFVALPLKPLRTSIYGVSIDKDSYFQASRFYLAVSAEMPSADLISRVPKLFKVCSATHIESLIQHALPGLQMNHVPQPPRAIPVKLKYKYFSLDAAGSVWEAITRARNLAVYAPDEFANLDMELLILLTGAA
jgi:type VI secretion system protein ImpJ